MRPLSRARRLARQIRAIPPPPGESFISWIDDRLKEIDKDWKVARWRGLDADGKLRPSNQRVAYDPALDATPAKLRVVLAHELGHFVLHPRLRTQLSHPLGKRITAAAEERASRFAWEEVDAEAFAFELLCPADETLMRWRNDTRCTLESLSAHYEVSIDVVAVQLMRALADLCDGDIGKLPSPIPACTDDQRRVAHTRDRATYVDAGPGTGKTRTLIERVRWLTEDLKIAPEYVLVLSFSNSAVATVRERLLNLNPDLGGRVAVSTIHGLACEIVRTEYNSIGFEKNPVLLDETGENDLLSVVLQEDRWPELLDPFDLPGSVDTFKKLLFARRLARAKYDWFGEGGGIADVVTSPAKDAELERFEKRRTALRMEGRWATFDDIIDHAIEALKRPDASFAWQGTYQHVIVDEAQDLAPSHLRLILMLASPSQPAWFAGDHRQSIYRFTGADPAVVDWIRRAYGERFEKHVLLVNHRTKPFGVEQLDVLAGDIDGAEVPGWRSDQRERIPRDEPRLVRSQAGSWSDGIQAVARQVRSYLTGGASTRGVVVLVDSNANAQAVVHALRAAGTSAFVPGALDIDTVGGDLASVLDAALIGKHGGTARIAMALGRELARPAAEIVRDVDALLSSPPVPSAWDVEPEEAGDRKDAPHSFRALSRFLFNDGQYLRAILQQELGTAQMKAAQVATILHQARGARAGGTAKEHRLRVARLIIAACEKPPSDGCRGDAIDAVRVMTVHQAKGREFERVVVLLSASSRKDNDPSEVSATHRWSPARSKAFVAASRGIEETHVILYSSDSTPSEYAVALRTLPPATPVPSSGAVSSARRLTSRSRDELWGATVSRTIDGGIWRTGWCGTRSFVRDTLGKMSLSPDASISATMKAELHERVSEALVTKGTSPPHPSRAQIPMAWLPIFDEIVLAVRGALQPDSDEHRFELAETVKIGGVEVRTPVTAVRREGKVAEVTLVLLAMGRSASSGEARDGLVDAVRAYCASHNVRAVRIVAITTGMSAVDHDLATHIEQDFASNNRFAGVRKRMVDSVVRGNVSPPDRDYTCRNCHARVVCPAYQFQK